MAYKVTKQFQLRRKLPTVGCVNIGDPICNTISREFDCAPTHCKRTDPFESSHLALSRSVECFLLNYGFCKAYCVSRVSISFVHNGNVRCRSLYYELDLGL